MRTKITIPVNHLKDIMLDRICEAATDDIETLCVFAEGGIFNKDCLEGGMIEVDYDNDRIVAVIKKLFRR